MRIKALGMILELEARILILKKSEMRTDKLWEKES